MKASVWVLYCGGEGKGQGLRGRRTYVVHQRFRKKRKKRLSHAVSYV